MKMHAKAWAGLALLFSLTGLCAADPTRDLIAAAENGSSIAVRQALDSQADVNGAAPDGSTALAWAARNDDLETAGMLLKAGANVRAANRYGVAPLDLACLNGSASMIAKLVDAGADVNAPASQGETPLMTASRTGKLDAVQVLLQHGAEVNARENWRGQTALMWAAAEGHASVVDALIKAGADIHARSKGPPSRPNPFTAEPSAAGGKKTVPTETKVGAGEHAGEETKVPAGAAASADATKAAAADAAKAKRKPRAADFTPFLFAVRNGQIDTVKVMLAAGADPNETLSDGTSALVLAAMNARYELGVVLLDHDARPNADGCGWTTLHQVAWTRRPNIHKTPAAIPTGNLDSLGFVRQLVSHGANLNARETKEPNDGNLGKLKRIGATAYLLAAKGADPELMQLLLELGADPKLSTSEHITPLEAAAGIGVYRVAESPGTNDEAIECVKIAYDRDPDVNHIDDTGRTAMHGAALRGANNIVQFLYDHGAKLDIVDKKGWTPLVIAEGVFYPNVFKTELETAELLTKLGAREIEVSEAVRYAGMDKDGRETAGGFDTTVGGGEFFDEPPPKPKSDKKTEEKKSDAQADPKADAAVVAQAK